MSDWEDLARVVWIMASRDDLRPYLLGTIMIGVTVGGLGVLLVKWLQRRGVADAIERRAFPAFRFTIALLVGLGWGAIALSVPTVPWYVTVGAS